MKKNFTKKLIAFMLAFAMVLTGSYVTTLNNTVAEAAAKKATLKLSSSSFSLKEKQKKTLTIKKTNVKKISSKKWSSTKKSIATVSSKGVVTAKKAGKATIKCVVKYIATGSKTTKTTTLKATVTVKKAAATATPAPTLDPKTELNDILEEKDITLRVKSNDTSNIGAEREVTIVGGTTDTMKVKDNGTMRKELSSQYLADNEMGLGVNLGNTMEATAGTMADRAAATEATFFEQAWSQPITTQAYIDCVHSYGINTLRIPVAWSNMDADDGTYTINEKYLGRVEEIANYALNNGMYVVIDDHWDNQWWGAFGAAKYDESGKKVADEAKRAEAWKRYEAYWTQIANRFKNYSDHLIFEGANEELGSRLNDKIYSNGYSIPSVEGDEGISGNLTKAEMYETTNAINQKFVDIIRSTGGNNESRHLLIAGFNTNISDTVDERFVMPKDPANPDVNKLFLSVHFYDPWSFCGNGQSGKYTVADRETNSQSFAKLQRFVDEGYAIIVGECGIVEPTGAQSSVSQWLNDVFTESAKYHAVPVLWEQNQYFDRAAAKLRYKDIAVLYNTITGANGDTSMSRVSGKVEISDVVELDGLTPVWSWKGKWYKNGGDNIVGDDKFEENGGKPVNRDEDTLPQFVPESAVNATITGDETALTFNSWGYQAFLKIDTSKYKIPVIAFDFLEGTDNEDNVMALKYGAVAKDQEFSDAITVDYAKFHGKGVVITDACGYSADNPYLCISFGGKPIVTGIYIYDLG